MAESVGHWAGQRSVTGTTEPSTGTTTYSAYPRYRELGAGDENNQRRSRWVRRPTSVRECTGGYTRSLCMNRYTPCERDGLFTSSPSLSLFCAPNLCLAIEITVAFVVNNQGHNVVTHAELWFDACTPSWPLLLRLSGFFDDADIDTRRWASPLLHLYLCRCSHLP